LGRIGTFHIIDHAAIYLPIISADAKSQELLLRFVHCMFLAIRLRARDTRDSFESYYGISFTVSHFTHPNSPLELKITRVSRVLITLSKPMTDGSYNYT